MYSLPATSGHSLPLVSMWESISTLVLLSSWRAVGSRSLTLSGRHAVRAGVSPPMSTRGCGAPRVSETQTGASFSRVRLQQLLDRVLSLELGKTASHGWHLLSPAPVHLLFLPPLTLCVSCPWPSRRD